MNVSDNSSQDCSQLYIVIKDFTARLGDELTIKEGDDVELISDDSEYDDGWYMGKNLRTNQVGLYPKVFTQIKLNDLRNSKPSLLRSRSRRLTPQGSPVTTTGPPNQFSIPNGPNGLNRNPSKASHNSFSSSGLKSDVSVQPNTGDGFNRYVSDIDKALQELKESPNQSKLQDTGLDVNNVKNWSPEQVSQYFCLLNFDVESAQQFANHKINGVILLQMELFHLKELEIASFGTRFEIYKEIEELRKAAAASSSLPANINKANIDNLENLRMSSNYSSVKKHSRKKSQSMDDIQSILKDEPIKILPINDISSPKENNNVSTNNSYFSSSHNNKNRNQQGIERKTRPITMMERPVGRMSRLYSPSIDGSSDSGLSDMQNDFEKYKTQQIDFTEEDEEKIEIEIDDYKNSTETANQIEDVPPLNKEATPTNNERKSYDNLYFDTIDDTVEEQFKSPRKAPQPPNYPSPISNQFNFKLPGAQLKNKKPDPIPQLTSNHSRNSSIGIASSIYIDTSKANSIRSIELQDSKISSSKSHLRSNSDLSPSKLDTGFKQSHRRYSSLLPSGAFERDNVYDKTSKPRIEIPTPTPHSPPKQIPVVASAAERRSVSAKEASQNMKAKDTKRAASAAAVAAAASATAIANIASNTQNNSTQREVPASPTQATTPTSGKHSFRSLTTRRPSKMQTSAFQEGIRQITTDEAIKNADYSGWMFKRGNLSIGSWKQRYFTLHKTRLSYFIALKDKKEKGLIDITSHKVLPATETEDKISAVYAATAGFGRFCFKLVPPAPGSRKGLTFTQQKVHYFAVETKEEMRSWMAALMKATIELDESIPVISSCVTPTIPLQRAQELMQVARENAKNNLENLRKVREEQIQNQKLHNGQTVQNIQNELDPAFKGKFEDPRNLLNSSRENSSVEEEDSLQTYAAPAGSATPSSTNSSMKKTSMKILNKQGSSPGNGMNTPYLVTSGLISPNTVNGGDLPNRMMSTKHTHVPMITRLGGDDDFVPPVTSNTSSFGRRVLSLRRSGKDKDSKDK